MLFPNVSFSALRLPIIPLILESTAFSSSLVIKMFASSTESEVISLPLIVQLLSFELKVTSKFLPFTASKISLEITVALSMLTVTFVFSAAFVIASTAAVILSFDKVDEFLTFNGVSGLLSGTSIK